MLKSSVPQRAAVQIDLQRWWRLVLILQPQPSTMPPGHEGRSVSDGELPAGHIHTQMRLTHLQEGLAAQQAGEEGIDLGERVADLGGPQIRSR